MHAFHRRAVSAFAGALALAAVTAAAVHAQPVHQIAAGESLWAVAAANGMSPAALAAANGISTDAPVQPGQVVSIPPRGAATTGTAPADAAASATSTSAVPAAPGASGGAGDYVVQSGDTLSAIAARQGVSVSTLAAANGRTGGAVLPVGRPLSLSSAGSSSTTATPAATESTSAASTSATPAASSRAAPAATPSSGTHLTAGQIGTIAAQNGVSSSLARAIAWQESGFDNAAVSNVGAKGIMQVMPGTWDWIGRNLASTPLDPASPADNVRAGTLYLKHLLQETGGDADQAAAGYYQGLASVRSRGQYDDTQQYVKSVRALRGRFGN